MLTPQIFTNKKLEDISPSTHNMDVPNVRRTEYLLLDIQDGFLNLMDSDGGSKDDVKVPETDVGKEIEEAFEAGKDINVTIISAMGEEQAISWVSTFGQMVLVDAHMLTLPQKDAPADK